MDFYEKLKLSQKLAYFHAGVVFGVVGMIIFRAIIEFI